MWSYNYNCNELYHWGVKGMRWGHHKANIEQPSDPRRKAISDAKATIKQNKAAIRQEKKAEKEARKADPAYQKKVKIGRGIAAGILTTGVLAGAAITVGKLMSDTNDIVQMGIKAAKDSLENSPAGTGDLPWMLFG